MRIPESESARWQEEIEEADSNTGERLSDYSSRVESIRGPSVRGEGICRSCCMDKP